MPFGSHFFLLKRISILLLGARFRFFEGLKKRWEEASKAAGSDFLMSPNPPNP